MQNNSPQSDLNRDIAEKIESGQYFSDARDWFYNKYQFLAVGRSYLIVVTIAAFMTTFIIAKIMTNFFPLVRTFPIYAKVNDATNSVVYVHKVGGDAIDPNPYLIQELLTRYVKKREEYKVETFEGNANFIRQISSLQEAVTFENEISKDNPDSPLIRYGAQVQRLIFLIPNTYRVVDGQSDPSVPRGEQKATIYFHAVERSLSGNFQTTWKSDIYFRYQNITYDKTINDFLPLNFEVMNYTTQQVE
ncbi:MAG: hypothetical protein H6908_04915 [Hyphomicrobiales bacterium]|nr:hypothetical protein [Hyphomicrobiales bacterium]